MPAPRILIVGGSTRAAADSVRRAGWQPVCVDLFADLDLCRSAEVIPARHYPVSLPEDVAHIQADGWFYCAALENHPEILERMVTERASYGPLIGTTPDALRLVRNPEWLAESLRSAGISALDVAHQSRPPIADGSWVQKPLAGAGGRSIRVWDREATRRPFSEPHYFQRRAAGVGLSAIFRVTDHEIECLGASHEIPSNPTSQAPSEFAYCGSWGPLDRISWSAGTKDRLTAIARMLARTVPGLRGLVGLDFRFDGNFAWLTEVNPRYTASVEVLELTSGQSFLNRNAVVRSSANSSPLVLAKQILYAKTLLTAPDLNRFVTTEDPWQVPLMADIPHPGTVIEPGWPVCTVLASGDDVAFVQSLLRSRMEMIQTELARSPLK